VSEGREFFRAPVPGVIEGILPVPLRARWPSPRQPKRLSPARTSGRGRAGFRRTQLRRLAVGTNRRPPPAKQRALVRRSRLGRLPRRADRLLRRREVAVDDRRAFSRCEHSTWLPNAARVYRHMNLVPLYQDRQQREASRSCLRRYLREQKRLGRPFQSARSHPVSLQSVPGERGPAAGGGGRLARAEAGVAGAGARTPAIGRVGRADPRVAPVTSTSSSADEVASRSPSRARSAPSSCPTRS
jgi:hypothetical protein